MFRPSSTLLSPACSVLHYVVYCRLASGCVAKLWSDLRLWLVRARTSLDLLTVKHIHHSCEVSVKA